MDYSAKIAKGPFPDARAFGMHFLNGNGHAHALAVHNYWQQVRNHCRCGATIVGKYELCECNLGKCTFEFRIYNGTVNPRKVHAYAALSQSMVAYARGFDDLKDADFPAFEYSPNAEVTTDLKRRWSEHLSWMFRNLYFSAEERNSLLYVIRNCQLQELGASVLADLETTRYEPPIGLKKQTVIKARKRVDRADNMWVPNLPPLQEYDDEDDAPFDDAL
jgi:hypothetical protein